MKIPRSVLAIALAAMLAGQPVRAAAREVIQTNWSGFQQQVAGRRLEGRSVRLTLSGGREVKTDLLQVTETSVVVRATRATRQWPSGEGKTAVPKEQIARVRFGGRTGRGRLLGTLLGAGAGAGIGAAVATGSGITEGYGVVLVPVGAVAITVIGGVAGYFIGRALDQPGEEFVILP